MRLYYRKFLDRCHNDINFLKMFLMMMYALSLIIFAFVVDSPINIFNGLITILTEPDYLITDYIKIAGIGAAFVNSGLLTLIFVVLIRKIKVNFYGVTYAALFTMSGFAFFGKNLFNVWFIIIGVYFYSLIQKDRFSKYIIIALFGTAMAPMATQLMYADLLPQALRLPVGIFAGILIGFILPPLSMHFLKFHQGYNLYNVGFTAGVIGIVFVSILKSFGYESEVRLEWSGSHYNNWLFGVFFIIIFLIMMLIGFLYNGKKLKNYRKLMKYPGRLVSDFMVIEGLGITLFNMGVVGIISTLYIILINGHLNGPTIGGILTVVGFGAFGKHPRNIIPIFIGVLIGAWVKDWQINDEAVQLAALFGTGLAPIAGGFGIFGIFFGILAGFIHSSVVLNVGMLHGGLNLYNNGFAAGFVAAVLVPIIETFREDDSG